MTVLLWADDAVEAVYVCKCSSSLQFFFLSMKSLGWISRPHQDMTQCSMRLQKYLRMYTDNVLRSTTKIELTLL